MTATVVAVHVSGLVKATGQRAGARPGLVAAPFLALAVPVVPLTIGIDVECADGTPFLSFNGVALGLGVVGVLAWFAFAWRLYVVAGLSSEDAERRLGVLGGLVGVGMLVEFVISTISVEGYCAHGAPASLYWHVALALAGSLLAGGLAARLRPPTLAR